eukprot:NODE_154_length_15322_cov_0.584510.p11 type:complete len:232 gc:universal NODE_154_length_15322_cov_0.584510:8354-7659(-)
MEELSLRPTVNLLKKFSEQNKPPLARDIDDMAQRYIAQMNKNYAKSISILEDNEVKKRSYEELQKKNSEYLEKEQQLSEIYSNCQKEEQSLYLEKTKKEDEIRELKVLISDRQRENQGQREKIENLRLKYKTNFGIDMLFEGNGYYRIQFSKFKNNLKKAYFRFRVEDQVLHAVEINPSIPQLPALSSDINDLIQGITLNPLLEQIRSILKEDPTRLTEIIKRLHKGWSRL